TSKVYLDTTATPGTTVNHAVKSMAGEHYSGLSGSITRLIPLLELTAPQEKEFWHVGEYKTIRWNSVAVYDSHVSIDYSADGRSSWQYIAKPQTTGSYSWLVPLTPSTEAMIRISTAQAVGTVAFSVGV